MLTPVFHPTPYLLQKPLLRSFPHFNTDLHQMEEFLVQNLTTWIANLDGSKKLNFRGFGINALFTLSRTPLRFLFLHATARFWNPVTHVFSFGGQEMCPTFEDFQALMESGRDEEILPQLRFGHIQALGRMCGLTLHDARSWIHDGELDIPSLVCQFSDAGDRGDYHWQGYRRHALCLCMLSHFLLVPSCGGFSTHLIEVVEGLKEGKSCIAMTLAETLMGLDAFHRRETAKFAGSPLLLQIMFATPSHICILHHSTLRLGFSLKTLCSLFLSTYTSLFFNLSFFIPPQVWLMDKLRVVDSCPSYSARSYFFRQRLVDAPDEGWWYNWMCSLSVDHIAWRCPWLNLPTMSYSMTRQLGIQLIGMTHYVFYFPFWFRRQFEHDQICLEEGIEYPATFPVQGA